MSEEPANRETIGDPTAPPTQLFNVYVMNDTLTKGQWVGGSYDNVSAVTIASAVYQAKQAYYANRAFLLGVFDQADTVIAFIGEVD